MTDSTLPGGGESLAEMLGKAKDLCAVVGLNAKAQYMVDGNGPMRVTSIMDHGYIHITMEVVKPTTEYWADCNRPKFLVWRNANDGLRYWLSGEAPQIKEVRNAG